VQPMTPNYHQRLPRPCGPSGNDDAPQALTPSSEISMTERAKTPETTPDTDAMGRDDQSTGNGSRLNPAGLTITKDGVEIVGKHPEDRSRQSPVHGRGLRSTGHGLIQNAVSTMCASTCPPM
jgi:hypothetical protein